MKQILIIGLVVLTAGCATSLEPTRTSSQPFSFSDTIILRVDQTYEEAFEEFARYLSDNDFDLTSSRKDRGRIVTEPHAFEGGEIILNAVVRDTAEHAIIEVSGKMDTGNIESLGFSSSNLTEVENVGMQDSPVKKAWNYMRELASGFEHEEIWYRRN
jgi:hypothetical protein